MLNMNRIIRTTTCILIMLLMSCPTAIAAEASMQVPRRQGYVGASLPIKIIIADAQQDSDPVMPPVEGLSIDRLATPSVSTQVSSINGVTTTRRTVEWTFLVGAGQPGTFF